MDQFQLLFRNLPASPVRGSWEEAAQDAVAAGLAHWVDGSPHTAINWADTRQASIARIITQPRRASTHVHYTACARAERQGQMSGRLTVIGSPSLRTSARMG
jgi:hypothetical protein